MNSILPKLNLVIILILIGAVSTLVFLYFDQTKKITAISNQSSLPTPTSSVSDSNPTQSQSDISELESRLTSLIHSSIATISGQNTTVKEITTKEIVQTGQKDTDHITLGSSYSSFSTSWVDVPDSSAYIDLVNDYDENAYVSFESSLKVAHGNGIAYARLYDSTNQVAVANSEISVTDASDYEFVKAENLPLWRGNNLYKVQIKSLNGFEVFISNARIKITY